MEKIMVKEKKKKQKVVDMVSKTHTEASKHIMAVLLLHKC